MELSIEQVRKYDLWNSEKKSLAFRDEKIFFEEGEIWWCSLGMNLGTESFGKGDSFRRPVLVIKKLSSDACVILPVSMKEKKGTWFQEVSMHGEKRWVLLHQIRMLHTKRFQRRAASINTADFNLVKEKLKALLEFS